MLVVAINDIRLAGFSVFAALATLICRDMADSPRGLIARSPGSCLRMDIKLTSPLSMAFGWNHEGHEEH